MNADAIARLRALGGEPAKDIADLMARVDLVVAVTGRKGLISPEWVRRGQGILALSNPDPEIRPEDALARAPRSPPTGARREQPARFPRDPARRDRRSRAPHRLQHVRGGSPRDRRTRAENELVPNPLRLDVHRAVARAVAEAAIKAGVARVVIPSDYQLDSRCAPPGRSQHHLKASSAVNVREDPGSELIRREARSGRRGWTAAPNAPKRWTP